MAHVYFVVIATNLISMNTQLHYVPNHHTPAGLASVAVQTSFREASKQERPSWAQPAPTVQRTLPSSGTKRAQTRGSDKGGLDGTPLRHVKSVKGTSSGQRTPVTMDEIYSAPFPGSSKEASPAASPPKR